MVCKLYLNIVVVQSLSAVWLFLTPWTAGFPVIHHLSPKLAQTHVPLNQLHHPTISSSVVHFSFCLQSFPASGSFLMSQLFPSGGQSIGASASVLPMNIQGWVPSGLTGLISLQSKGLSRVSPTPQFKSINAVALSLLYGPTLTSIHDYWKAIAFTIRIFVSKGVSLFFNILSRFVTAFLPRSSISI